MCKFSDLNSLKVSGNRIHMRKKTVLLPLFGQGLPSPSLPSSHYVVQAGFNLTEISLPLPPKVWD